MSRIKKFLTLLILGCFGCNNTYDITERYIDKLPIGAQIIHKDKTLDTVYFKFGNHYYTRIYHNGYMGYTLYEIDEKTLNELISK